MQIQEAEIGGQLRQLYKRELHNLGSYFNLSLSRYLNQELLEWTEKREIHASYIS
jgi:hypothetical protein